MDEPRNSRKTGDGERSDGRERVGLGRGPVSRRRLLGMTALGVAGIGASSGATARSPSNVLTIEGTGPRATYEFSVSGDLEKSTENDANVNGNDEITGSSASGVVGISADSYAFSGDLVDFSLDGDRRGCRRAGQLPVFGRDHRVRSLR